MAKVIVLGGGVCGLASGLMLARDGHEVTVLERDPAPVPDSPERAWEDWERRGVAQFRQAHYLQPRARTVLEAELPDVLDALAAAGAARLDWPRMMPPTITDREPRRATSGWSTLTARRTTLEQLLARAAEAQDGLEVRRGAVAAAAGGRRRRRAAARDGRAHGRAASGWPPTWWSTPRAAARGCRRWCARRAGRRSGSRPRTPASSTTRASSAPPTAARRRSRGPLNTPFESFSVLTLPADAGTWSVTLYASAGDQPLKRMRHEEAWTAVTRACPLHAHWLDGEPLTGILPMGGMVDRRRRLPADGSLTGLALRRRRVGVHEPVGRPRHRARAPARVAAARRRRRALGDADALAARLGRGHRARARPVVRRDRGRRPRAHGRAARGAHRRPVRDPRRPGLAAARRAAAGDGRRRGRCSGRRMEIIGCVSLPAEVFSRPGVAERVMAAAAARGDARIPGPGREELLEILSSAGAPAAAG